MNKHIFFLILFGLTFFVPSFETIDLIASKTLYLSVINLFFIIFYNKEIIKVIPKIGSLIYVLFAFFILCLFSITYAINPPESVIYTSNTFIYLITFVALFNLLSFFDNPGIVFSTFLSLILFGEVLFLLNDLFMLDHFSFSVRFSGAGNSSNINISTFSSLFKLPFLFISFTYLNNNFLKGLSLITLLLSTFFILLQGSRAGLLVLFIYLFLLIIFFLVNKEFKLQLITFLGSILLFFILSHTSENNLAKRVSTTTSDIYADSSISYRLNLYSNSLTSFFENPIFGSGAGNYKISSILYNKDIIESYIMPYHTHNDFLEVLVDLGFLGFALFSSFFILLGYKIFKLFFHLNQGIDSKVVFICLLSFIAYVIDSLINFPLARTIQQFFLMSLAAFVSLLYFNNVKKVN